LSGTLKVTQPVLDKELEDMKKTAILVAEAIAKGAPPPAALPPKGISFEAAHFVCL
jgi:hypothetical protein